jgi:hypothetical protein
VAPLSFADSLRERRDLVVRHPDRNRIHPRLKPFLSAAGVKTENFDGLIKKPSIPHGGKVGMEPFEFTSNGRGGKALLRRVERHEATFYAVIKFDGLVKSPSTGRGRLSPGLGWGWNHLNSLQMAGEGMPSSAE